MEIFKNELDEDSKFEMSSLELSCKANNKLSFLNNGKNKGTHRISKVTSATKVFLATQ